MTRRGSVARLAAAAVPGVQRAPGAIVVLCVLAALCLLGARPAAAQEVACDPGDVEVRALEFEGNRTFSDAELARGLAVTPSSWVRRTFGFFGRRRCVVRDELRLDVARLALYYRKRGFPQAQVDTVITEPSAGAIAVRFVVDEGPALRLDTLRVTGLEELPDGDEIARDLGIAEGERFDQYALDTARVVLVQRLRNGGHPYADVLRGFTTHLTTGSVAVDLTAIPGPRSRIGRVNLEVTPREGSTQQIPDPVVRGLVGLRPGAPYSERELVESQRRLYQTDAFAHVEITIDSLDTSAEADTLVDVYVRLRETFMRTARLGVGYGTLDCFRVSGEFTDVNFLRSGRRLELNARTSKIGVGAPLDVNDGGLCFPDVRDDVYSDTLNYYVGATLRTPRIFGYTFPTATLYSERRSEFKAFLRTTPIALGLSRNWARGLGFGVPLTGTYNLEYGRTEAQPAFLCAAFNLCEAADRERVGEFRRLAVLGGSAVRDRTDDPVEPTRGTILRLDARHASPLVGSDGMQAFNQLSGAASWYQAVSDGLVLAARLRMGAVLGSSLASGDQTFVPPQERLYAGGPNTVRGFQQNELGPVAYLANGYDTVTVSTPAGDVATLQADPADGFSRVVPVGGASVIVANLEARIRGPVFPNLLQFTLFLDAGKVSDDIDFDPLSGLRWTPGVGVRLASPVGPLRLDVGYNPYDRAAGAAYFDAPLGAELAPLYCVSPGNQFPVSFEGEVPVQTAFDACPATFRPDRRGGLLRRMTLNISIGQAF